MKVGSDITAVSLGGPQPGFWEQFRLGCLGERVHLRASNSNLGTGVKLCSVAGPALLTKEVGQADVSAVRIVVPWNVNIVKRVAVGYRYAYTQQRFGWLHSGHHLLG